MDRIYDKDNFGGACNAQFINLSISYNSIDFVKLCRIDYVKLRVWNTTSNEKIKNANVPVKGILSFTSEPLLNFKNQLVDIYKIYCSDFD